MSLINDALKRAKQAQGQKPQDKLPPVGVSLEPVNRTGPLGLLPLWFIPVAIVFCLILASAFLYYGWHSSKSKSKPAPPSPFQAQQGSKPPPSLAAPSGLVSASSGDTRPQHAPSTIVPPRQIGSNGVLARVQVNTNLVTRTTVVAVAQPPAVTEPSATPSKTAATIGEQTNSGKGLAVGSKPVTPPVETPPPSSRPQASEEPSSVQAADQPLGGSVVPASDGGQFPNIKLQGIFLRMTKSSAIVNGRTVHVGDSVEGVKIIKIERQLIVVDFKGVPKTIFLP